MMNTGNYIRFRLLWFLIFMFICAVDLFVGDFEQADYGYRLIITVLLGCMYYTLCFVGGLYFMGWACNVWNDFDKSLGCWTIIVAATSAIIIFLVPDFWWKEAIGSAAFIGLIGLGVSVAKYRKHFQ